MIKISGKRLSVNGKEFRVVGKFPITRLTQELRKIRDKRESYDVRFKRPECKPSAMMKILSLLLVVSAAGCTKEQVRMNLVPQRGAIAPRTIQIEASSSINGRPMGDDPSLRSRVAAAFQKQFPGAQVVQSEPDMVVFFTIVDYVPGCSPDCKKFKTYRNWTCEVEIYPRDSHPNTDTIVFNLDGSTYNPFHNPASSCASRLLKATRSEK
jgi:hypothetical protein